MIFSSIREQDFSKSRTIHSKLKLIFRAASNLAQLKHRPSPDVIPIERAGPPHFLHLVVTAISTIIHGHRCVAIYKGEAKWLVLVS